MQKAFWRPPPGEAPQPGDETHGFWILTADCRQARLLQCWRTEHGRLHVEARALLEEDWDEFQHGRPSPRGDKNGHTYASTGNEEEERVRRFAHCVAEWLESELDARGIGHVHAFSARRLLGDLRRILPERLRARVQDHAAELAHLTPAHLARHEAVLAINRALPDPQAPGRGSPPPK